MALSIKNQETERLARELARATGVGITRAVTDALREALHRRRGRRRGPTLRESLLEISARCAALPDLDTRSPEEILGYDDTGAFG